MSASKISRLIAGTVSVFALTVLTATPALAHQGKDAGNYHLVVGFSVEPAFQNQLNAVELFVTTKDGKQVEGLEKTLSFVAQAGSQTMPIALHTVYKDPGHYKGELVPTAAGDYVFQLKGTINDHAVDEIFVSGPGRFSAVNAIYDVQFPVKNPLPSDVALAQADAQQARTLAIIGIVVGVIGIGLGGAGLLRRKA